MQELSALQPPWLSGAEPESENESCIDTGSDCDPDNYIGKRPALPGDSKRLTAPYFETLRNA